MNKLCYVSYDDLPDIHIQIIDETTDLPIDISSPTTEVYAKFRETGTIVTLFDESCEKLSGGYAGQVKLVWPITALDVNSGLYEVEIYLVVDSKVQTVFERIPIRLRENFAAV